MTEEILKNVMELRNLLAGKAEDIVMMIAEDPSTLERMQDLIIEIESELRAF